MQKRITVTTKHKNHVVDITDMVQKVVDESEVEQGLCGVFVTHTTAALSTADLDPGTDQDILDAFNALVPDLEYRHPHDPSHVGDHILSTLVGTSESVPVADGQLVLGTWQHVILCEFDGPRDRTVIVTVVGA